MPRTSRSDRELSDAAASCGHLVPEGSAHAYGAEDGRRLFPDEIVALLSSGWRIEGVLPGRYVARQGTRLGRLQQAHLERVGPDVGIGGTHTVVGGEVVV